jgi:hypothetical protein
MPPEANRSVDAGFLTVDDHRSSAKTLAVAIRDLGPTQAETVADAIKSPEFWSAGTILIIPRLDTLRDAQLAELLAKASQTGARVFAGFDQSRPQALVSFRLSAWIAQQVAPMVDEPRLDARGQAARLLRAGIIAPALELLAQAGLLKFDDDEGPSGGSQITVVDDIRLLSQLTRAETKVAALALRPHDLIVFTATDFSEIPPVVREKNVARVVKADPERSSLTVTIQGEERTIDLEKFAHLRSAETLSLSEARRAPHDAAMNITISLDRHGYACALLAATHRGVTEVRVSANVAHDVASLAQVIEYGLVVPLLWHLQQRPVPHAEANVGVAEILEAIGASGPEPVDPNPHESTADDASLNEAADASGLPTPTPGPGTAAANDNLLPPSAPEDADIFQSVDLMPIILPRSPKAATPKPAAVAAPKPLPARLPADLRRAVTSCTAARKGFDNCTNGSQPMPPSAWSSWSGSAVLSAMTHQPPNFWLRCCPWRGRGGAATTGMRSSPWTFCGRPSHECPGWTNIGFGSTSD